MGARLRLVEDFMGRFRKTLGRAVSRMRRTERKVVSPEPQVRISEPEMEALCSEFVDSEMLVSRLQSPPRLLLVNHWATWCEGCVEELPLLVDLYKKWSEHVDFVGVSWEAFQGDSGVSVLREVHGFIQGIDKTIFIPSVMLGVWSPSISIPMLNPVLITMAIPQQPFSSTLILMGLKTLWLDITM